MNALTTVTDGDDILRMSGTFGQNKTVTINNFGGVTYLHLKCPKSKSTGFGWKTYTLPLPEYRELIRMAGPNQLATIAQNFDVQNRRNAKKEKEALIAAMEETSSSNSSQVDTVGEPIRKKARSIVVEEEEE